MPYDKTIVCLANSRKISGRCIAGKEVDGTKYRGWIRPVSKREAGEISEEDRRFQDGSYPGLLDVVQISFIEPRPAGFQTENHLIDDGFYWEKVGTRSMASLRSALDEGPLWLNASSSVHGLRDRIVEEKAAELTSSLKLIEVADLAISVALEGPKRKVRGRFSLNNVQYILAITDPGIEREYLAKNDGEYQFGAALLCISLGEPFNGFAYKLIAAIFKL